MARMDSSFTALRPMPNRLDVWRALLSVLFGLAFTAGEALAALLDGQPPPYIVTPQRVAERMLEVAKVRAADHVIDLGSGDGRIVIAAAKRFGASGLGVELRGDLVAMSQRTAEREGVAERARFAQQDALLTDLSKATVLTLYLGPELNEKLMPRILATMRPGARVVSHDFGIGLWTPDHAEQLNVPEKNDGRGGESAIMLWIVPGNAAGRWKATIGSGNAARALEFSVAQQFQRIEAAVHAGAGTQAISGARLVAERISLPLPGAGAQVIHARIEGDRMTGSVGTSAADPASLPFVAQRIRARPDLF